MTSSNIRIAIKYMINEAFSKLFTSYIMTKLEYAPQLRSPHLKKHKELTEKVEGGKKDSTRIKRAKLQGKAGGFEPTLLGREKRGVRPMTSFMF